MSDCTEGATFVWRWHALLAGSLFVALGLTMFAHASLLTDGVAGVASERVLQSLPGAVAIGAILTLNHRPGRCLGV